MIKKFIEENNILFSEGNRNFSVTILIGYSLFLGLTEQQLIDELQEQITNDIFILQEIVRLFDYCKKNNYNKYWECPSNKFVYKY